MTVIVACPERLPTLAVIFVVPAATAVITPLGRMVATDVDDDDHATAPVAIDAPFWSAPVAVAVAVWPTWIDEVESETVIVVSSGTGAAALSAPPLHDSANPRVRTSQARDNTQTFPCERQGYR
jgi:hypothetical protein